MNESEDILRTAVIDADVICHQAAAYCERSAGIDWGIATSKTDVVDACMLADDMVHDWTARAGCDHQYLVFSGESDKNFRKRVFADYKLNRKGSEKPEHYYEVRDYLRSNYLSECWPTLEGDDVMGLILTTPSAVAEYVAVSTDKDILTLPGKVVRVPHNNVDPWEVKLNTGMQADKFWMYQTIVGDNADGYKGAPGAGPSAARTALYECRSLAEMWQAVLGVYENQWDVARWRAKFVTQGPYSEALMNARCARILRDGDFDYYTTEVKLWHP